MENLLARLYWFQECYKCINKSYTLTNISSLSALLSDLMNTAQNGYYKANNTFIPVSPERVFSESPRE